MNKMKSLKNLIRAGHPVALLGTLGFFFLSCFLVSLSLSAAYRLEVSASATNTDYWQLFFSAATNQPKFNGKRASNVERLTAGEKETLIFSLNNVPVSWLRIDPGGKAGTVRLYSLAVKRRLAADKVLTAGEIYKRFRPGHAGISMTLGNGFVEIVSTVDDPFLISRSKVVPRQHLGIFVVPVFLLSFFFYQYLAGLTLQQVCSFFLVNRELPPGSSVIGSLDGLRGVAALMVVADHTWPSFLGIGASGVLIFFALSGFLLARPFVTAPQKIRQRGFLLYYGKRRLKRILPMYYLYILLVYVMSLHLGDAIMHAFFLKGDGHLWAIPQEMLFYVVFPAVVLVNLLLFREKIGWILSALLLLVILSNRLLGIDVFSLNGMNGQPLPFYLGVFLSGCWTSYFYFGWFLKKYSLQSPGGGRGAWGWTMAGCSILILFLLFSNGHFLGNSQIYSQRFYALYGAAAAVLILSLLIGKTSSLARSLSLPFLRSIGVVSYSLYLLHPLILELILAVDNYFFNLELQGGVLFVLTSLISLPVAVFTYRVVEYPFLAPRSR